jgi:Ni,Fe-hydrogenase I cytochrome b subunit
VFTTLYTIIAIALPCHFLGNILTGRAKRRFIDWEWPHHDGPPLPVWPKLMHFQHVAAMIALVFSGMYIRFPFFSGGRTAMRYVHYVALTVVIVNLVARLWYAFGSTRRDYREFVISKQQIITLPQVLLYYTFFKPSYPHLSKYNIMQKMTYSMFAPLLIAQAFTGLALLTFTIPLVNATPRFLLVGWWLGAALGSVDLAGWWMRTLHYLINWMFILFVTIHVYLSLSEDFAAFLDFFGLSFLHGGSDHGDDHGHDHGGHEAPDVEATPALASSDHL